jgi:hypothetical protein
MPLLTAMFFLLPVELLAQILIAGAGVSFVEVIEGAFAVGVSIPLHGHKERNTSAEDGVEVGGQELGGGEVTTDVRGGGKQIK